MKLKSVFLVLILIRFQHGFAQTENTKQIDSLIKLIASEQVSKDSIFRKGSFPSYRKYGLSGKSKADANIFFTSLTIFTLQELIPFVSEAQKAEIQLIKENSFLALPYYRNKKGRNTYNFWQTNPPILFPNSVFLSKFSAKMALADDPDDTVFPLMVIPTTDSLFSETHDLLKKSANIFAGKKVKNTFLKYRNFQAHSAWFGKKMPIEFDFALQCNTLYFLQKKNLKWNNTDSATLNLLIEMVKNKEYLKHPAYISPYYQTSPILLYHLSRLMSVSSFPELEKFKPELVAKTQNLLAKEKKVMNKVILSTSLLRWGQKIEPILLPKMNEIAKIRFAYYSVRLMVYSREPFKTMVMNTGKLLKYDWYAAAYNHALVLEYLVLKNAKTKF